MTPTDILTRLFTSKKPVTPARIVKAQGLAARAKIEWAAVLAAMTKGQRAILVVKGKA